jgi:predicted HTH transcriptional regulator
VTPKEAPKPKPINTVVPQGIRSTFAPHVTLIDADVVDRQARTEETRSSRREVILGVISHKDNCSIKDIAGKLSSVSEKTIQRELSAMVEEGILIKEGDRRWSTYRVARHTAVN